MGNMSGSYGDHYTIRVNAYVLSQDYGANKSTIRADLWLDFDGSSYWAYTNYTTYGSISINGNTASKSVDSINYSSGVASSVYLGTHDVEVTHNNDGSCGAISVGGYWNTDTTRIGEGSASTSVTPPSIPRYANFTEHYVESTGLNSIKVHWNADASVDWLQYSLNGGNWANTSGHPTYTITGLAPNTTYNIRTRIRRTDSGLWTESGTISGKTKDIAKITKAPNIDHGNSLKVEYSNPSGSSLEIGIWKTDGTTMLTGGYRSCSGSSYTFNFTDEELDRIYKLYGNNNQITVRAYLRTAGNANYLNYKDFTITLKGNQKTLKIKENNSYKRGKLWVKVSNEWKRAVIWIKIDGIWRRGI